MPKLKTPEKQNADAIAEVKEKRCFKRQHQQRCGFAGEFSYDDYSDVREACERKLLEWERLGIIPRYEKRRNNDWLFAR